MKRPPLHDALVGLARRYGLPDGFVGSVAALLGALAAEPDPHTTVSDPVAAIDVHVADSLAGIEVPELREARRIADVGAGAGFPGIVLAAALPAAQVDLIEAASRKTAVIERLASAGGLDNARAVTARAEDWAAGEGAGAYDAVTARAVAPLAVLAEYAAPLLALDGALVAWKGARDPEEEAAAEHAAAQLGLEPLDPRSAEPYSGSRNRHLHVYLKVQETPPKFPRRAGMAAKRPLG